MTAIENRVLNKTYEQEPVEERLNRLEAKVFGKPSRSDYLSERVDKLKQSTGIDVAGRPPVGSDWTDDDDDIMSELPVYLPCPCTPYRLPAPTAKTA